MTTKNPSHLPTLPALLDLQQRIHATCASIDRAAKAQQEQHSIIDVANRIDTAPLESLRADRAILLAELATGEGDRATLKALDERIDQEADKLEQSRHTVGKAAALAQETMAGLQRKIDAMNDDLDLLRAEHAELLAAVVAEYGQALAEKYLQQAATLTETLAELNGFARLRFGNEHPATAVAKRLVSNISGEDISLPAIGVWYAEMQKAPRPEWWLSGTMGELFSPVCMAPRALNEHLPRHLETLRALGIDL